MANKFNLVKMKIWEHIYLYTCVGIIAVGVSVVFFWWIMPEKVMTIESPVKVDKETYRPGERITYTLSYCKKKAITATVYRTLVNGTKISFTEMQSDLTPGCREVKASDLIVPEYVDGDKYHLEGVGIFQVNPIKTYEVRWRSQDFFIKK